MKKKVLIIISIILIFIIIALVLKFKINNKEKNTIDNNNSNTALINSNEIMQNVNTNVENTNTNSNIQNTDKTEKNETTNNKIEISKKEEKKTEENIENNNNEIKNTKNNGKKTIVIDPGHQTKGDTSKEPIGPGATETKDKVTTGATGIVTKQKESELVLKVALMLEKELEKQGYTVIMTRTTNNVNISNSQRAKIANDANADAFIRLHADSYDNPSVNRNFCIMPNIK